MCQKKQMRQSHFCHALFKALWWWSNETSGNHVCLHDTLFIILFSIHSFLFYFVFFSRVFHFSTTVFDMNSGPSTLEKKKMLQNMFGWIGKSTSQNKLLLRSMRGARLPTALKSGLHLFRMRSTRRFRIWITYDFINWWLWFFIDKKTISISCKFLHDK